MTKMEFQIVEMLGRVVAFGEAYEPKFPKTSLVWLALTAIRSGISKTYELAALQNQRSIRLCTDARQTARDTLNAILDARAASPFIGKMIFVPSLLNVAECQYAKFLSTTWSSRTGFTGSEISSRMPFPAHAPAANPIAGNTVMS